MSPPRLLAAVLLGLAATAPPAVDAQVTYRETYWGFGGQVVPGQFTPVTVLLDNPTPRPFEGDVYLYRENFLKQRVGALIREPFTLEARTSNPKRVDTFYVLPFDNREVWKLEAVPKGGSLGDEANLRQTLPRPGVVDPPVGVTVLLTDPDDFTTRAPEVPRMDESLFPPRPEGTGGLAAVVLDHAPNWGAVREGSFMAWLTAGGTVHLLTAVDGSAIRFGGPLTPLNDPSSRFAVGRGTVLRHARGAAGVTEAFAKRTLLADATSARMSAEDLAFEKRREQQGGGSSLSFEPTRLEDQILPTLRRMVRPEFNWGLIHVLCLAYVAALFPGVFLVGRERRGYPATLGLLVVVTLSFGVALRTVGRQGYGESRSVRTTALVRALPPGPDGGAGVTEVTQWSDVFVTGGGDYTFAVAGDAALYSTGETSETVKGVIDNGTGANGAVGTLTSDLPPFSSRAFVARSRRDEAAPAVRLLSGAAGATTDGTGIRLRNLRVQIPPEIDGRARLFAVHSRHVYPLLQNGGVASPDPQAKPIPLSNLLGGYGAAMINGVDFQDAPYGEGNNGYVTDPYGQNYGWEDDEELVDRGLDLAARQLIGRDLGFLDVRRLYRLAAPADRVRIYAVMPLRDEHRILGVAGTAADGPPTEPLPNQNGTTILAYEFPL